ncbi:MAG: phosphatidylcholine synthase [Methylobacteriaceae bacterium]|nr:phosphatidylcholine synthase [Methylobacteriaceae bacterium]
MNFRHEKVAPHARRAAGYSVHLFTASGGAVAVLALYAAIEREFAMMFAWLGLALFIDGVDGTLARAAKVKETAAAIDGATLDFVVDFLTYVLVPVVALWRSDLMPERWSFWLGLVVTMASALYFADSRMKTADNWFRGFPAIWNVFVLYLFIFRPPALATAVALLIATAAMFAPIVFVHPMRVAKLRALTLTVTALWFICASYAVWDGFDGGVLARAGLALSALYVLALPFLRHSPFAEDNGTGG